MGSPSPYPSFGRVLGVRSIPFDRYIYICTRKTATVSNEDRGENGRARGACFFKKKPEILHRRVIDRATFIHSLSYGRNVVFKSKRRLEILEVEKQISYGQRYNRFYAYDAENE